MAILQFSKWRPSAILDFKNLQILSCSPCRHAVLLPRAKFRWNRTTVDELWPKKLFLIWRPPPSRILKISIFGHVTVIGFNICCSVPNFFSKSHNFSRRYGDLAIFKMAAVLRHLGFVMTSQYIIAGHIFVVQISSWNFMLIGFVVSEILAISYVVLLAVHDGPWRFWGCACDVPRDP